MPAHRYKITVAYDGTDFHGWQIQTPPTGEPLRTVQGVLTEAMAYALAQPVFVQGASRTDAGVHAEGQVAHFDAETRIPLERIELAINARLPPDVEVRDTRIVADDFDAIRDAVEKQYCYRIWTSRRKPLGHRHRVYQRWCHLDVERMQAAAALVVGEHDFAAFATAGHGRLSTIRSVTACEVHRHEGVGDEIHIVVQGKGFLYNMVRIISGTLLEVGRSRYEPQRISELFTNPKRDMAGPTLPAHGLCLQWIRYPHHESIDSCSEPQAPAPDQR